MEALMFNRYIEVHQSGLLQDLKEFIRIPSISTTGEGIPDAVSFVVAQMSGAGFSTHVYQTAGHPIIFGAIGPADAGCTLLMYGHYDVFPADDQQQWRTPPFEPIIEGDRLYGRGAGDNKGQLMAHIQAIKMYRQIHGELPIRVKLIVEGEEETGSQNLPVFVAAQQEALRADLCFYSDGPMFPGDQPILVFGVRGALCLEFVSRGARRVLHSGNFGGVAPNPLLDLCRLLSQMVAPDGQFLVPGIEEGVPPLSASERRALEALPIDRENIVKEMGVAPISDRYGHNFYERLLCRPNFNVSGFSGGFVGNGVKTIIPNEATARVDIRLVGDQDPDHVLACLRHYVKQEGFEQIEIRKLVAQPASKTPIDNPYAAVILKAVDQGFGRTPLIVPSLGGTTPDYVFTKLLNIPSIVVPYAPHDENNHAPNESTKVSLYLKGIKATALLLAALGQESRMQEGVVPLQRRHYVQS